MRTKMGFEAEFERLFFSCELGVKKPDSRFYEAVEAALGLSGKQIRFWDDTPSHIEAAKKRGWQAVLYTDSVELSRQAAEIMTPI